MASKRKIVFSPECDRAAKMLGGYEVIDCSLDPIYDALWRNPYGFPLIQSDWYNFRIIVTKPIRSIPALVWTFTVENEEVTIRYVEAYETFGV